jgi:hypothetical protein
LVTASKGDKDQHVDEEKLDDVDNNSAERDLQRTQMRRDGEHVYRLQITGNNGKGE